MKAKILYSVLLAGLPFLSFAQKGGCIDPLGTNYDATATFNNGSCQYRQANINIGNGVRLPQQLDEISGMVYWNGKMYGHQDSGGPTNLYEFDPSTGQISKTITLQGITNVDWEDMTQDDTYFYIGDVGSIFIYFVIGGINWMNLILEREEFVASECWEPVGKSQFLAF